MRRTSLMSIFALVFLLSTVTNAHSEEIKVAGGGGPVENILKPIKTSFEKATGITLKIMPSGATVAFKELEKGSIDASTAGFSFEDLVKALNKEGHEVKDLATYRDIVIGKGNIYAVSHKNNTVSKLSKEQLKGIFTGKISNWKDVGGKDMPFIVAIAKLNPATNSTYMKAVLDGEPFTKDVLEATTSEDLRQNVSSNAEAIGFGPITMVDSSIKVIETPEVSRPIILITKGAPSASVQKLLDYIKGEGQKYVKQ